LAVERLLVVVFDDDEDTRVLFCRLLNSGGFQAVPVESGRECSSVVAQEDVDAILLDLLMPEIDGFQYLRRLREERAIVPPVIVVTVRDDQEAQRQAKELGVADYLVKPVFRRQLLNAVRRCSKT
jgi:two-component system OmpR family response regulator